jgi:type II secretory pathway pseudopilin PulG
VASKPTVSSHKSRGFTIIKIVTVIGVVGVAGAVAIATLVQMNHNASRSRLRMGAARVAQKQIDYLLSIQPYNRQKNQIPPELALGIQTNGSPTAPTVPIYTDPRAGRVRGWITTEVTQMMKTVNGINVELRRANVTVSYIFRGRVDSVDMSTVRAFARCPPRPASDSSGSPGTRSTPGSSHRRQDAGDGQHSFRAGFRMACLENPGTGRVGWMSALTVWGAGSDC